MDKLKVKDSYKEFTINALNPNPSYQSIVATKKELYSDSQKWYGYTLNNNDAAARWVQVFYKPAANVAYGVDMPNRSILIPASGNVTLEMENPVVCPGFTVAAATTETGTSTPTLGVTGTFYFAKD